MASKRALRTLARQLVKQSGVRDGIEESMDTVAAEFDTLITNICKRHSPSEFEGSFLDHLPQEERLPYLLELTRQLVAEAEQPERDNKPPFDWI